MSAQVSTTQASAAGPAVKAWTTLLRAHASTSRALSASLQTEHGLSLNDFEALYLLSVAPNQRLKRVELARLLVLTPSGVTRMLEGLEVAGLVCRAECPGDLRVTYAQLTPVGQERLRCASCGHHGSIRTVLEQHLTASEIDQLTALLAKLPGVTEEDEACLAAGGCG